jgi:hypothetical protein
MYMPPARVRILLAGADVDVDVDVLAQRIRPKAENMYGVAGMMCAGSGAMAESFGAAGRYTGSECGCACASWTCIWMLGGDGCSATVEEMPRGFARLVDEIGSHILFRVHAPRRHGLSD